MNNSNKNIKKEDISLKTPPVSVQELKKQQEHKKQLNEENRSRFLANNNFKLAFSK